MNPREIRVRAFAKLNLGLRVLRKRNDGFHELRTIFQTISLADRIWMQYRPAPETRISVTGTVAIADNIIDRAARLVISEFDAEGEFSFDLEKRIPMGAGLGGGSSDAAAILLGLPALLGRTIEIARLRTIAAQLGSDVPFFLHGGTAVGLGRGDELYPLPDRRWEHVLLVAPEIQVSTAEAYRSLGPHLSEESVESKLADFTRLVWAGDLNQSQNDFETPVFGTHPRLNAIRKVLADNGASCARMTGSGSALFGLFPDPASLERARQALTSERTYPVSFVSRKRYQAEWSRARRVL